MARAWLKRASPLVPIGNRYYIPSRPCVAGNPVFYVDKDRVVQCGNDLSDLFNQVSRFGKFAPSQIREESFKLSNPSGYTRKSLDSSGRHPWWIEYWSDIATADEQRRKSVSSSSWPSSQERFVKILPAQRTQHWVDEYVEGIASILKDSRWSEQDVREMTVVPASDFFREGGIATLDRQVVLDMLLLKVDRFSEMMRNDGWSADDVSNALEPGLRPENEQRPVRRLPPRLAERFEKLAEWVTR